MKQEEAIQIVVCNANKKYGDSKHAKTNGEMIESGNKKEQGEKEKGSKSRRKG